MGGWLDLLKLWSSLGMIAAIGLFLTMKDGVGVGPNSQAVFALLEIVIYLLNNFYPLLTPNLVK